MYILSQKYFKAIDLKDEYKDIFNVPTYINYGKCVKIFLNKPVQQIFLLCEQQQNENVFIAKYNFTNNNKLVFVDNQNINVKLNQIKVVKQYKHLFITVIKEDE